MMIPENIVKLHDDLIEFSSKLQATSSDKMVKESHITPMVYTVFYKIVAYAVTLHRAILTLRETGWAHLSTLLLRTIMECSANCLAIINNDSPEYMAFKYLCHPNIRIFQDDKYPAHERERAKIEIEKAIYNVKGETVKQKAKHYVDSISIDIFWFKPEEKGVSSIIKNYGIKDLEFVYGAYSMSAHAAHLGMFMLKDNPGDISINPCENPRSSNIALIASCRWFLELLNIRNEYEELGFKNEYSKLLKRILAFEGDVRG